jgi:hypothetical protein
MRYHALAYPVGSYFFLGLEKLLAYDFSCAIRLPVVRSSFES